jgi:hypothetical protein
MARTKVQFRLALGAGRLPDSWKSGAVGANAARACPSWRLPARTVGSTSIPPSRNRETPLLSLRPFS